MMEPRECDGPLPKQQPIDMRAMIDAFERDMNLGLYYDRFSPLKKEQ